MTGSIRGRVITQGEAAVPDASIVVVQSAGPAPDIAPLTDMDGAFALDDLAPGRWVFRAHTPAGATGETAVSVLKDAVTDLTIVVQSPGDQRYPAKGQAPQPKESKRPNRYPKS